MHDPRTDFVRHKIQTLLESCSIKDVCTSAKNPQSNAVCETMHQTVGNVLRILLLGIVLDFKSKTITIDEIALPMRNINLLQGSSTLRALKLNNSLAKQPLSTLDATKCVTHILDVKYAKADLQSIVKNNCKHLSAHHQKKLLQLLVKFGLLFGGTLGDWKTKPVSFQLKEGASSYHG